MLNPTIRKFEIKGLLGEKDVDLEFSTGVNILMADNGMGKTTILNVIYSVLAGHFHRLRRVDFTSIHLEFSNGKRVSFGNDAIQPVALRKISNRVRRLLHQFSEETISALMKEAGDLPYHQFFKNPTVRRIAEISGIATRQLHFAINSSTQEEPLELVGPSITPGVIRESLNECFPYTILYFPTYRRIEEDQENLGYERKEGLSEGLLQFGMTDVKLRIKNITDRIRSSSVAWYSKINGEMLSQLVDGIKVDDSMRKSIRDKEALKIVLDRIGEHISKERKLNIMTMVASGEIDQNRYDYLVYFLSNLVKIYDQQKDLDNAIKDFTGVCNKYLGDKEIVYNESAVDIGIVQKRNKKPIDLAKLSSGEKQIVSLFSRIYLEQDADLALLFDEPELSLSIEWQKMLIPDIVKSGRCRFILATTHSPFVFENEFDLNARDLSQFITYLPA